jgi:hypothetical protein
MKGNLTIAILLKGPNWGLPFHIHTDASDKFVGAVLVKNEDDKPYVIYFISKNLACVEMNYTVTENELSEMVHALNKFKYYVAGYKKFVHT